MQDSRQEDSDPNSKRTRRARKPVTLLQHEYSAIYSDAYNRKLSNKPPATVASASLTTTTTSSSSASFNRERQQQSSSSSSSSSLHPSKLTQKQSKKRKDLNERDEDENDNNVGVDVGPSKIAKSTVYQWIGNGECYDDDKKFYERLEIMVGNHPALIKIGDSVLLSSDNFEEKDVFDTTTCTTSIEAGKKTESNPGSNGASKHDENGTDADTGGAENVAMNQLKPFVGKVEAMWEEGNTSKGSSTAVEYTDERRARMKIRIRWYYKKQDVEKLNGSFDGISRQTVLSYLTPRDLVLGDVSDENEVTSILGKCRVMRRKPELSKKEKGENESASTTAGNSTLKRENDICGAFRCNFDIAIRPKGVKNKITIEAYDGPDIDDSFDDVANLDGQEEDGEDAEPAAKRSRVTSSSTGNNESYSVTMIESENEDDDGDKSFQIALSQQLPTTEGSATQKIVIGENHQATIPDLMITGTSDSRPVFARRHSPEIVWKPGSISDEDLDTFIENVTEMLKEFMRDEGIQMTRTVPHNLDSRHLPSNFMCRELNMDQILKVLHNECYQTSVAMQEIREFPRDYLVLWTKEDKEMYNSGFKTHFGALRHISKGMTSTGKDHTDVVDYHYRFKIPDQFRRYLNKKREQARRMLDCVEKHRLQEYLSSETAQAVNNSNGSEKGNKKNHNWSRTGGGGPDVIGVTESRRLDAKIFLDSVRDAAGAEYSDLVKLLKGVHSQTVTIPECREGFAAFLGERHPDLMRRFDEFLPTKFRTTDKV